MRFVDLPFALLWVGTLSSAPAYADGPWSISSPSGNLSLVVEMKDSAGSGAGTTGLSYRVLGDNCEMLPSAPLGITLKRLGQFTESLQFVGESTCAVDEQYTMPVGKREPLRQQGQ